MLYAVFIENVDFDQKIDFLIGSVHFGAGYLYVFLIQVFWKYILLALVW